ncbi:hypothetical protein [Paragemmobacter straminiformis]
MNNTVQYRLFDTAVNGFVVAECGFSAARSDIRISNVRRTGGG